MLDIDIPALVCVSLSDHGCTAAGPYENPEQTEHHHIALAEPPAPQI
jgi:hypothetical protein